MKSVEYSLKEVDWSKPVKIIMKNEVATLDEVLYRYGTCGTSENDR